MSEWSTSTSSGWDAEPVGDDHRPRCLVALTVRRRARDHLHLRGRHHADRGRFPAAGRVVERGEHPARRQAAHLDVGRDPDAEMAGGAGGPALSPARRGPRPPSRSRAPGERRLVVAAVEHEPGRRRVRELVGRDVVAPADLCGVDADLAGERVHGPLDRVRCLWPPCAAVGVGRRLGREDRRAPERVRRTS